MSGPTAAVATLAPDASSWAGAPASVLVAAEVGAATELRAMRAWNAERRVPMRIGFARPLATALELRSDEIRRATDGASVAGGVVATTDDGTVRWRGRLRVAGAERLRAGLKVEGAPAGATVVVTGSDGGVTRPRAVNPDADGRFWSPSGVGPEILVELEMPAAGKWAVRIDQVVQIFDREDLAGAGVPGATGDCVEDAACFGDAAWPSLVDARTAVARIHFMKGPISYLCTGGLLNDTDPSTVEPYLLTGNHCIPNQAGADTLESFWDYIAPTCGGEAPDLRYVPRVDGATLLATSVETDFAFLRLSAMPEGERMLLGWSSDPVAPGTEIARLSHPGGGELAFSTTFAVVTDDPLCHEADFDGRPWHDQEKFRYQTNAFGGISPGSSGAPQFLPGGIVVGQFLGWCGTDYSDFCSPALQILDGRFDVTFPKIASWLDPAAAGAACTPGAETLCIDDEPGDRRFEVGIGWATASESGAAKAIPLASLGVARGGLFWFFSADNPELLVKVLDGCAINDHFWIFTSAGTNVGVTVDVRDTVSGATWTRTNPMGTPMPSLQDTSAMPCP